jgi:hypothetical protein
MDEGVVFQHPARRTMVPRPALALAVLALLGFLGLNAAHQREVHPKGVEKLEWMLAWRASVPGARALSTGPDGILAIADKSVALLGADGAVLRRYDRRPIAVGSTGDLDGDGVEEIVLASEGPEPTIEALDRLFKQRWSVAIVGAAPAARLLVADLDGDGRREVVVGAGTTLYALSGTGRPLWKHDVLPSGPRGEDAVVRGLDDARLVKDGRKTRYVAFALQSGTFGVVAGNGASGWTASGDKIRRLRAVDLDGDGTSELITGHEGGGVGVWDLTGRALFTNGLGQAVTEVRAVEVDGDPKRRELALGSKKGAVRVTRGPGAIFSASVPGKVSAIGGVDLEGDGRDEVFVGTEEGALAAFGPDGRPLGSVAAEGKVEAIVGVVSPLRDRLAVVASAAAVSAWRVRHARAPAWYRPETGAAAGGLAVIVSGLVLFGLRARPTVEEAPAPDGRALRREALDAARGQVASLLASGNARADQAEERLQQLDRQLAKARPREAASPSSPASPPPPPRRGGGA